MDRNEWISNSGEIEAVMNGIDDGPDTDDWEPVEMSDLSWEGLYSLQSRLLFESAEFKRLHFDMGEGALLAMSDLLKNAADAVAAAIEIGEAA
jgi:hypothetical protein